MAKATDVPAQEVQVVCWPAWTTIAISPLLYAMIVPLAFLDLCLELYHRIAFPFLGIPTVARGVYIKIDRHKLPYLPPILKVACAYCGYANGLIQYAARIAGDTEAYFCPIKHQKSESFHQPAHHRDFAEYGDAGGFTRRYDRSKFLPEETSDR